jgi:MscS family membrane protein
MLESLSEITRVGLVRVLLVILTFALLWVLRRFVAWLFAKPLCRILKTAKQPGLNESIRHVILVPITYFLLALAINVSAQLLQLNLSLMDFTARVTRTLVIIGVALLVYRLTEVVALTRQQLRILTGLAIDEALLPFIRTSAQIIVLALALVIIIQVWGYDVTGLVAGLGLGGLAISLAAQDTLSNLFGFSAIVSDRPFVVGEYIKTKDVEGSVERVGLRSTRVRQIDQAVVAVPNNVLMDSAILNWSRLSKRKIEFKLGLDYRTNADQIEALLDGLREMLNAHENIDPSSVVVYFVGFGQSSLDILVRCYLTIPDWKEFTAAQERVLLKIMRLVDSLGLQTSLPTQAIHFEATGGTSDSAAPLTKSDSAPIRNERG